jgi:rhodanese-related sulfurtransferase
MKKHFQLVIVIIIFSSFLFSGCKGKKPEIKQETLPVAVKSVVSIGNETSLLLKDLKDNGDYVNSKAYPSLIKASIVNESIGKNVLIIDLRSAKQYSEGHIKSAVNKKFEELPSYFETGIKPFEYDKIIIVSEDGQVGCYATCLLRLMGYGNVYAMRWGMSAWNNRFAADGWLKGISGKFETKLENTVNERPSVLKMPDLKTGATTGSEIGTAKFRKLFEEGSGNVLITADEVFENPAKFYIINLERKDKYEDGHIPGAVRYKPEGTLGFTDEMASIPTDKPVVVYCGTGHNSGFATAYLRLLGYDAHTLKYGNNGFMHEKMLKERTTLSWLPFTSEDVNNFEVVK